MNQSIVELWASLSMMLWMYMYVCISMGGDVTAGQGGGGGWGHDQFLWIKKGHFNSQIYINSKKISILFLRSKSRTLHSIHPIMHLSILFLFFFFWSAVVNMEMLDKQPISGFEHKYALIKK